MDEELLHTTLLTIDLLAHGQGRKGGRGPQAQRFQPLQRLARGSGIDGRERAFAAAVHRLDQGQRLRAVAFAQNQAFGQQMQRVRQQIRLRHHSSALIRGRRRFQPHQMAVMQLQFRRLFN